MRHSKKTMVAAVVVVLLLFWICQQGHAQVTFSEGPDINDPNPVGVRGGGAITCLGDTVYVLVGGRRPDFFGFNINSGTWTQLADAPADISGGASMAPAGDFIYASQGDKDTGFFRYDPDSDAWTTLAGSLSGDNGGDVTNGFGGGSGLAYPGGDYIYAIFGQNDMSFARYSIPDDRWEALPDTSFVQSGGADLVTGGQDDLYAFAGQSDKTFYRYQISTGTWTDTSATLPVGPEGLGNLSAYDSSRFIYVMTGEDRRSFLRYDTVTDVWEELPDTPFSQGGGAGIVFCPQDARLYAISGGGSAGFYTSDVLGLIPLKLNVKLNPKKPGKDSIGLKAEINDCCGTLDPTKPVTLSVGGFAKTFTFVAKGSGFAFKDAQVKAKLKHQIKASSKDRFQFKFKGDLAGLVDTSNEVLINLRGDGLNVFARVVPASKGAKGGKFGLGKNPLLFPRLFPRKVKINKNTKKPGSDSFSFKGGIANGNPAAPTFPNDITFDLGGNLNIFIAGEDLIGKDGKFKFKGDLPRGGSVALKVDANKGVIQIKGKKLDLGALAGTDFDLHLAIGPDFEETVTVRMTLKKDRRSY